MDTDLGLTGLGLLIVLSLAFGGITHFLGRPGIRYEWLLMAAAFFLGGLFLSEVMFAGATEAELQPIIDGLAFDEALLGGLVVGLVAFAITRYMTGGSPFHHRPTAA
jgi:hypothetical protein